MKKIKQTTYSLLRHTERYTKTDMVYVFKGGSWITIGNLFGTFFGITTAYIFANYLPQETYGEYKYVLSVFALLSLTALPELSIALTHAIARGHEGDIFKAIQTKILWGLLGSLISIFIACYYFLKGNDIFTIYFLLIALFVPFHKSFSIYISILNGRKLFKKNAQYQILTKILGSTTTILAVLLSKSVLILLLVFLCIYTFLNITFFYLTIRSKKLNNKSEEGIVRYGKQLTWINIFGNISSQIDTLVLWHFLGAQQVAIYMFSILPVNEITSLLKFTTPLAVPKIVTKNAQELKKIIPGRAIRFAFAIIPILILYILVAPYAYNLLFPLYTESIFYSQLAILSLLLFPKKLFGIAISVQKKKKAQWYITIINAITKIILLVILVPLFGILGSVIALILSNIIHLITLLIFSYCIDLQD